MVASDEDVRYRFFDPVCPGQAPERMVRVCSELDGTTAPLRYAREVLEQASHDVGSVTVENGYVCWEIAEPPVERIRQMLELLGFTDEVDQGDDDETGRHYDAEGGAKSRTRRSDVYEMLTGLAGGQESARTFVVLIRFVPASMGD